jgi:hypothetical protein
MFIENLTAIEGKKKSLKKYLIIGWVLTAVVTAAFVGCFAKGWIDFSTMQKNVVEYLNSTEMNFADITTNSSIKNESFDSQRISYFSELAPLSSDEQLYQSIYEGYLEGLKRDTDLDGAARNNAYDAIVKVLAERKAEQYVKDRNEYREKTWSYITSELGVPEDYIMFYDILLCGSCFYWYSVLGGTFLKILTVFLLALIVIMTAFQIFVLIERKKKITIEQLSVVCNKSSGKTVTFPIKRSLEVKPALFKGIRVKSTEHGYYIPLVLNRDEIIDAVKNIKSELQTMADAEKNKTNEIPVI